MKRLFGLTLIAVLSVCPMTAQDDAGDAPDHGVARLSVMNGNVSVAHGDAGDLTAAALNIPLVATDRILTAENSRAEVQFDGINMVRLAPMTEVRLGELQYKRYLVQIAQGTVTFRVLRDTDAQIEISTPNSSVRPLRAGSYRVTVHGDGTSEMTVRDGEAEISSPTGSEPLRAGTTIMSRGSASDPEFRTTSAIPYDEWDRWNSDRDRVFERAYESSRYASPDVYGTEELANHGRWVWDPVYGYVWVPNVNADWAPYRYGRWSYIDYYGWSWVSYDPWGWAPYHYGRWYRGGFGWAWYPGPVAARYYWRPALVGFFGWGSPGFGVSVGFGFGNVGWVPLAPHEPFRPWYGHNVYVNRVNVMNNVNVVNVYQNARYTGSVTSMRAGDFGRGSIDGRNFVRGSAGDFARAGMINGSMPFSPSREARQFGGRDVNMQSFPRTGNNSRFFSAPPVSQPGGIDRGFAGAQGGNAGGWRRIDSGGPGGQASGAPSSSSDRGGFTPRFQDGVRQDRGFPGGGLPTGGLSGGGFSGGGFSGGGFSNAPRSPEPVQIRPPIVTDRNAQPRFENRNPAGNDSGRMGPGGNPPSFRDRGNPGGGFGGGSGFGNFGGPRRSFESRPPQSPGSAPGPRNDGGGFRSAPPPGGGFSGGGNRGGFGGGNPGGGGGNHGGGNRGGGNRGGGGGRGR